MYLEVSPAAREIYFKDRTVLEVDPLYPSEMFKDEGYLDRYPTLSAWPGVSDRVYLWNSPSGDGETIAIGIAHFAWQSPTTPKTQSLPKTRRRGAEDDLPKGESTRRLGRAESGKKWNG